VSDEQQYLTTTTDSRPRPRKERTLDAEVYWLAQKALGALVSFKHRDDVAELHRAARLTRAIEVLLDESQEAA
jgi:hypothetical protein